MADIEAVDLVYSQAGRIEQLANCGNWRDAHDLRRNANHSAGYHPRQSILLVLRQIVV